ncbi:MAG: SDR family NAD(P)-dependent oxidoreductase [Actinobacteria bacterium]|nr:SDR family NAD(P)-dependent oxidoreductase [Actinomycetota bacterium]
MTRGAVVITGSSTGIGRACALHLAASGFQVFAGVRRQEDGDALQREATGTLDPLLVDVTDGSAIAAARERVEASVTSAGLAGLVNNAGIAVSGPLEFVPIDDLRRQLEVNLLGHVAVTQAFLPLIRRARGRIVNVTSVGGRVANAFLGPYQSSKWALEALTDVLRKELRPWGIHVAAIEPGAIATPMWEKGADEGSEILERLPAEGHQLYGKAIRRMVDVAARLGERGAPPERVASAVEHALTARRPRPRYLVGVDARVQVALNRLLPARANDALEARLLRI